MNRKDIQRKLREEQRERLMEEAKWWEKKRVPEGQFNRIYDEYCDKFDLAG